MNYEIRRFAGGSYTLLHDRVQEREECALDLVFYFLSSSEERESEDGGYTCYTDGEEELLTVEPIPNTLGLVYRNKGAMRFVKYLRLNSPPIFDIAISMWEEEKKDGDEEETKEEKGSPVEKSNEEKQ